MSERDARGPEEHESNVGRKHVRPSRIKAFGRKAERATAVNHIPEFEQGEEEEEEEEEEAHNLKISQYVVRQIERQVGDALSDRFSLNQTPESRGLVLRSMSTYL